MKIEKTFKLREIAGETIIVNQGAPDADLTRIISLNASARWLWEQLMGREFTLDDAASLLTQRYGIAEAQARQGAEAWAEALRNCGVLT